MFMVSTSIFREGRARQGCLSVCAQGLCKDAKPTKHTQPFTGERGFRQGCRNKDTPSFKHGCLQVVEQSRCRTHRQQTTTVAQRQSHQSVLKGIGIINQNFISKTDFFYKLRPRSFERGQLYVGFICLF